VEGRGEHAESGRSRAQLANRRAHQSQILLFVFSKLVNLLSIQPTTSCFPDDGLREGIFGPIAQVSTEAR
jgi:hypothetical protein